MGQRENTVETYLTKRVEFHGGITRKWVSPNRIGVPDRIVIYKGRIVFVEVKTVEGALTVRQQREHNQLQDAGAEVVTVYGNKGVDDFIRNLINV